ncbi:MAG: lactoylglutathione lyase [Alphaproteobacteria bacterium]|nr:lactoylglutathione lyase [Alphaproteobacteria bacterium]
MRIIHTMLRVGDLDRSLAFYVDTLGMTLFRREEYPAGRFTLAFVGFGSEASSVVIELTHNWDISAYDRGNGYGHIALGVTDAYAACEALAAKGARIIRPAGPMSNASPDRDDIEVIAFIEDPDGYRVELIETS